MCLDAGTKKKYKRPIRREIIGYKIFLKIRDRISDRFQGRLEFYFYKNQDSDSVLKRRWIKASRAPGFHVFKKRQDALRWSNGNKNVTVRKIKARNITHRGEQCGFDAYIAKEIYVP